jgi:hypothetical protein
MDSDRTMRIARGAPLLIALLFLVRVSACGSQKPSGTATGGSGVAAGASGVGGAGVDAATGGTGGSTSAGTEGTVSCSNGTITYTVGGMQHSYHCPDDQPCSVLAKTGMGICATTGRSAPFQTCRGASDCQNTAYCSTGTTVIPLSNGTCLEGVCDWMAQMAMPCGPSMVCYYGACGPDPSSQSTSGGFPWGHGGNTGTGAGGTGGVGGDGGAGNGGDALPASDAASDASGGDASGQ